MKTKIIGLVAITLALVMTMGTVSANSGYTMDTELSVDLGSAYQVIDVGFGVKLSEVTIGNYFVDAECEEDPVMDIPDLGIAIADLIEFDIDLDGSGEIQTEVSSIFDERDQYQTIHYGLDVEGVKAVVRQEALFGIQELLLASDGEMDFSEDFGLKLQTCRYMVVVATVDKSAEMLVNRTLEPSANSVVFHTVNLPFLDPPVWLFQYAEGPSTGLEYHLVYTVDEP